MRRAVAFISSTVKDLAVVREHLRAELDAAGFDVRMSEDDSFPVSPGETSHDACLAVVRTADLFVLLVGKRYGGEYPGHNKSITWREWDEAMAAGLHPIVLIDKEVNEQVIACGQRREALWKAHPSLKLSEVDQRLATEFDGEPKWRRHLPGIQRFVDALRKGHADNWIHGSWDGQPESAWSIVRERVSTMFGSYRSGWCLRRAVQDDQAAQLRALGMVAGNVSEVLAAPTEKWAHARTEVLEAILDARAALFGLSADDRCSITLHCERRDAHGETCFVPVATARSHGVSPRGRVWARGQGHVGLTAEKGKVYIAPDLVQSDGWDYRSAQPDDHALDIQAHRSAVAMPLREGRWVFTVTTSRNNHFAQAEQSAVLTFQLLGRMIEPLLDWPSAPTPVVADSPIPEVDDVQVEARGSH